MFYEDQCSVRECRLSEEIDLEFEEEKQQKIIEKEQELEEAEKIEQFTNPIEYQEIINITPTRTRKQCSDIEDFKTPSPVDIGKTNALHYTSKMITKYYLSLKAQYQQKLILISHILK